MKWLISLFFIFSFINSFSRVRRPSINHFDCPGLGKADKIFYKEYWKIYSDKFYKENFDETLTSNLKFFKNDCKDPKYTRAFEDKVKKTIRKGQILRLNFLKKEILRVSKYRLPDQELEQLDVLVKKLGKTRSQIISEIELNKLISNSKKNRDKIKSSCTNKDNRRPPLGDKVRDQDGTGWCYAYTAADLISHKTGKLISAVDVANSYNNSFEGNIMNFLDWEIIESEKRGGKTDSAIKEAVNKGVCLEKNVRSSDFTFQKYKNLSDSLKGLEKLKKQFDQGNSVAGVYIYRKGLKYHFGDSKISKNKPINTCNILDNDFKQIFNSISNNQMIDILTRAGPNDIINQAIKESCRNKRLVIDDIEVVSKGLLLFTSSDNLINDLNTQLNNNNIVDISYYASLLYDPHGKKERPHGSIIVARKFNKKTNSCDFLIRNSWGNGCAQYSKKYECKRGQIWIPQEYLAEMIYGITYIK